MHKARLEAFSDGVFAIVITLLVLDLRPDTLGGSSYDMLVRAWPRVFIYVFSFVIVGVYWVAHHNMLHFIRATDRGLLWLNLLLLLVVAFIPYPAALLGATHADAASIRIYGATLCLCNLIGALLWAYATAGKRLVSPALPRSFARFVVVIHSLPIAVYLLAIALAPAQRAVSLGLFVLVPASFILPNPWLAREIRKATEHIARAEQAHDPAT